MVAARKKTPRRYSYADYLKWDDDKRYELIDGAVYDMNAPLRIHQKYVGELMRQMSNFFLEKTCEVYVAPFDVRLPRRSKKDKDIFDVVQPDISIICDQNKLDDKGCIGAPDLIVEVISPSTAGRDQIKKRALYESSGVREFWLLHPDDRLAFVYLLDKDVYGKPAVYDETMTIKSAIFPGLSIDLAGLFPPSEKKVEEPPAEYHRL